MSDQGELRDRIADMISDWVIPGVPPSVVAWAIIDELGLTVQERFVYATDLARDDEPVTDAMAQRVVGKWEQK